MSGRRLLVATGAFVLAMALAIGGVAGWLFMGGAPAGGLGVATAWRAGSAVARQVATGDVGALLGAELAQPGTTVVREQILREGRVFTLSRRLFGLSFFAGRDGVRATLDGKDALLTPTDLTRAGLYRGPSGRGWAILDAGLYADGVLDRLARDLGVDRDRLWREGRFHRFLASRSVSVDPAAAEAAKAPEQALRRDSTPTAVRLRFAVVDAAAVVERRVRADGAVVDLLGAGVAETTAVGPGYDWGRHAAVTAFLGQAGSYESRHQLRSTSRRAGALMRKLATLRCGPQACVGAADAARVDIGTSALALIAYSELARERAGLTFREPADELSVFLRSQQRSDGGFSATFDRAQQKALGDERSDVDALASLALARAFRVTRNPGDLEAARAGIEHLTARPALAGVRDLLGVDPRTCVALDEASAKHPLPAALDVCLRWTQWIATEQTQPGGPVADHTGGYRAGPGWMPSTLFTAARTEGAVATLAATARAGGQSFERLRALDAQVSRGVEFLLRMQLPGARAHLLADPAGVAGSVTANPVDLWGRLDETVAVGSIALRTLRALEARGVQTRPKPTRLADVPVQVDR